MLLLVITEAAAGYVCGSICENACESAGQSVLSEFNAALYARYGVLALRTNDTKLSNIASYYIGNSITCEECIVKPKLTNCQVSSEIFPALNTELFKGQIEGIGLQTGIYSILSEKSLKGTISGLLEALEFANGLQLSNIEDLETIMADSLENADENILSETDDGESALETELGSSLLESYNQAVDPDFESTGNSASISNALQITLPSTLLENGPTVSLLLSGGITDFDTSAIACGEYILNYCSSFQNSLENTVLKGEIEYILYGYKSEGKNLSALKRSLFAIRYPLNLKALYSDPVKMADYNSSAAAFLPIPIPFTVFVLASVEASAKSLEDIDALCSGKEVPFIKGGKGGTYSEYLRILLLMLPRDTKMLRLMDIMQMNLTEIDKEAFAFKDFCYGFTISAEFEKRLNVSVIDVPSIRTGKITKNCCYQ